MSPATHNALLPAAANYENMSRHPLAGRNVAMIYQGGCHCGQILFEVEGDLTQVADCNCSICSKMGSLHWFVPRDKFLLLTPESKLATYTFGPGTIRHHFCPTCGIHPFGEGADPSGHRVAAVNARCLADVELSALSVNRVDGRSL